MSLQTSSPNGHVNVNNRNSYKKVHGLLPISQIFYGNPSEQTQHLFVQNVLTPLKMLNCLNKTKLWSIDAIVKSVCQVFVQRCQCHGVNVMKSLS